MAAPTPELSPDELAELLSAYMPDIPGYRVLRRLGSGGMSYVYLGLQESLDRQVAIKVISPVALKDEISKLRFEREAHTIAKLQHPAIVNIYEVGRTDLGLLYYVMPYLPRGHLGQRDLREDEPRLIAILRSLLWALDYAHGRGVVHRDIKKENVLFDNVDRPLLTDFGIAMHRADRQRVTDGGFALGSGTHMAPEQARGEKVDGRADLYSIGILTYELLLGDVPFQAEDALSLAVKHAVDPVPRLPAANAHWQPFIDRALAKTPDARFASAQEMMTALDHIERDAAVLARQAVPAEPVAPVVVAHPRRAAWLSAGPLFLAASACVLLVLAIVVALQAWGLADRPDAGGHAVASAPAPAALQPAVATPAAPSVTEAVADAEALSGEPAGDTDATPPVELEVLAPGEREVRAAATQVQRRRLTQPPGDNALESLLAAHALVPQSPRLAPLGEAWLDALQPYVRETFASGGTQPERRLYDSARQLAATLALQDSRAWRATEQLAVGWLRDRLQAALAARDLDRLRAAKADASSFAIDAALLEPEWSQAIVQARLGDRLTGATLLQLARLPDEAGPGLALMPTPVTRGDYARFAAATGRAAASCRVRTAMFTLRKRRWDGPGFTQQDDHPVVCVSMHDALAYATWLGRQDGQRYRLASSAEWHAHVGNGVDAAACRDGRLACGREGTLAVAAGGVMGARVASSEGNIREWPSPCAPGCARQPTLGISWRDAAGGARGDTAVPADVGYDDIGFRLLREVARAELEQR